MGGVGKKQIAKLAWMREILLHSHIPSTGDAHDKYSKYYIENTWWLAW
jgi:hypothetical protein